MNAHTAICRDSQQIARMIDDPNRLSSTPRFQSAGSLITHDEAIALLKQRIAPIAGRETVLLSAASGRILAEAAIAAHPVPLHTNSAVDGYAFVESEVAADPDRSWPIAGRSAAGHPFRGHRPAGCVIRALTGAVMAAETDTVAMQEDCSVSPDGMHVRLPKLKRGANVRRAGEDVAAGTVLFEPGHVLRPQDLAALASVGIAEVPVFKRLRIAVVSSGDEIKEPGSGPIAVGEVYDANAPMLAALGGLVGATVTSLGILADDRELVQRTLADAAPNFDVVLTSGGASQGEEDHMAASLGKLGSRHFWQVAIKPGRPMMFGEIGNTVVVGLPGNPVAVFVCGLMYAFPMLRRLGGAEWPTPRRYRLPAAFAFEGRKIGRREFWRGILADTPAGLAVEKFPRDGSGLISGLRVADGLIDIPETAADIAAGDLVDFIPFSEFGIAAKSN
jgi:molybdopterin molybdotransferase